MQWAKVAGLAAKMIDDLSFRGEAETCETSDFSCLHLIERMITAHEQQPNLGFDDFAFVVALIGGEHEGFHGRLQRHIEQGGNIFAGALAWRRRFLHRLGGCGAGGGRCALGFFNIRCVIRIRAVNDRVFSRGGNHLEFFAQIAANRAAVCRYRAVAQAKAIKYFAVCASHDLVAGFSACFIAVKAVGIFHDELAPAHQAKARTAFIAEFGLDLVEVFRQLLVAFEILAGNVSDAFFAGGLNDEIAVVAIFDAQQLGAVAGEAPGFLPQLSRLNHGHGAFDSACAVHFFAHDRFHLADHAQAHGHVGVDASAELFDHARAGHELVAGDLCIRRSFFEGVDVKLAGFHGDWRSAKG